MFKLNKKFNIYYFLVVVMTMMIMTIITVNEVMVCWGLLARMNTQKRYRGAGYIWVAEMR
jgi:hypothetical protein